MKKKILNENEQKIITEIKELNLERNFLTGLKMGVL